jgi:hypothetical protein
VSKFAGVGLDGWRAVWQGGVVNPTRISIHQGGVKECATGAFVRYEDYAHLASLIATIEQHELTLYPYYIVVDENRRYYGIPKGKNAKVGGWIVSGGKFGMGDTPQQAIENAVSGMTQQEMFYARSR